MTWKEKQFMKWFRGIITFIRNVIKWRKVLLIDQDWDYWHLLYVIEFKLSQMVRHFKNNPYPGLGEGKRNRLDECIGELQELLYSA